MPSPTAERERAIALAPSSPDESAKLARTISHPWFRCQALAWSARYAPERALPRLLGESLASAAACDDPYERVAATAWPFRAMVERHAASTLPQALTQILRAADQIPHPVRRLDALHLVWQALFPLGPTARQPAQDAFIRACHHASSWRAGRALAHAALLLTADDPTAARAVVDSMPPCRFQNRANRDLAARKHHSPRPFF